MNIEINIITWKGFEECVRDWNKSGRKAQPIPGGIRNRTDQVFLYRFCYFEHNKFWPVPKLKQLRFLSWCKFFFRMEFIQDYTLKSLRLKPDKWNKLIISDEQRTFINNFIERGKNRDR